MLPKKNEIKNILFPQSQGPAARREKLEHCLFSYAIISITIRNNFGLSRYLTAPSLYPICCEFGYTTVPSRVADMKPANPDISQKVDHIDNLIKHCVSAY